MKNKRYSLILNILIIIFEIIGFLFTYVNNHSILIQFYTEDSNILALVTSCLFVYFLLSNKKLPKWLNTLKYISTTCVTITFLVVIFILAPMYNFNYLSLLFDGTMLYHHTICPLLCIITFLFFDKLNNYEKKDILYAFSFTIIYAVVLIALNLFEVVKGPYPFLMVKEQTIIESFIWIIVILGFAYMIAKCLFVLKSKRSK